MHDLGIGHDPNKLALNLQRMMSPLEFFIARREGPSSSIRMYGATRGMREHLRAADSRGA